MGSYTVSNYDRGYIFMQPFMQHIEFFHIDHFENNYHRIPPPAGLSHFIEFFWETRFEHLWHQYPGGFSDAQFPNIGYTYIINLGTPFVMQVSDKKFPMKADGFLPRYNAIECFHQPGIIFLESSFAYRRLYLRRRLISPNIKVMFSR